MTQPEPLRRRIDPLLDAHLACARRLQSILLDERKALLSNDVAALEQLTRTKSEASEELQKLADSIESIRRESGATDLTALLGAADSSGSFLSRWNEVIELARACADGNRENAGLLEARQNQIRSALTLLSGDEAASNTYGRSGDATTLPGPRSFGSA